MSINIGKYTFEGAFSSTSQLKDQSGVYVILGSNNKVIDVGESEHVKTRVENHDRESCWQRNSGYGSLSYAALYVNEAERMKVESELRDQFNPPCGDR